MTSGGLHFRCQQQGTCVPSAKKKCTRPFRSAANTSFARIVSRSGESSLHSDRLLFVMIPC